MKQVYLLLILFFCSGVAVCKPLDDEKTKFKKIWKLQQMYLDSISAPVDSTMQKYRLILANDSICYLHDGTQPMLCFWKLNSAINSIDFYTEKEMLGSHFFMAYKIMYVNEQNLIVTINISGYNSGVKLVEYRLVPDDNYVFQ
jgi:hypothetical protein